MVLNRAHAATPLSSANGLSVGGHILSAFEQISRAGHQRHSARASGQVQGIRYFPRIGTANAKHLATPGTGLVAAEMRGTTMIRSIITATAACAAAACMIGAAVPALAQSSEPTMTYSAKSHLFCAPKETVTGSLIAQAECHTAAAWSNEGLTVRIDTQVAQR